MYKKQNLPYERKILSFGGSCVDPLPTAEELNDYYATKYYQEANGTTSYDAVYTPEELQHKILEANLALEALNELNENKEKKLSLIEFGCGEGFFIKQICQKTNWNAMGVDFSKFGIEKWNPDILQYCSFGDIYHYLNSAIKEHKLFDICALRNVLEHVRDPFLLLKDLKKLLNKDGSILITVPNDYSTLQNFALECGAIDSEHWFLPPDHLYYFNASNIVTFVENIGYKVVDMFSSFPVDFFLFHPGSNYSKDKKNGKAAHFARVKLDLLMAESGIKNILNLYRSMAKCGVGRDVTIIIKPEN